MYRRFFKRVFDLTLALVALLVLLPFLLVAAVFLYFVNERKVFFFQERPGFNGKIFRIIKFKTMNDKSDVHGVLLPDHLRLTTAGRFIRKISLDEVPQLYNVLTGDMSIIGPRPLLRDYINLYSDFQKQRHNVRPGITGWAQIQGRNSLSWEKKFEYDVWYVHNLSFFLDIKILLLTILKVVKSEGISSEGSVTMETFLGSEDR